MLLPLWPICLVTCGALAISITSDKPFTGGILSVTAAPRTTAASTLVSTGDCNLAGPLNQTGSYLYVNDNIVPPTSYFVPCSSFLSKYGLRTTSTTSTQPISTYTRPKIVDCASLILNNRTVTGSTVVDTYSDGSLTLTTQACTAWAANSKSYADSPQGTAAALYSACQSQAVRIDVDKNPLLTGITGSVVVQVYPGSLLGSENSQYRNSTSFPLPYSTANPSGGIITTMPCASFQAAYVPYYKSIESSYSSWKASITSFWRSPQCTSLAKAVNSSQPPLAKRQIEFQGWNGNLGVPFGPGHAVHQVGVGANVATCCGPCQVIAQTLSMLYWPKGSTTPVCSDGPVTSLAALPSANNLAARGPPSVNGSSVYAVVDGSTLTSPSVYMAFQGSVWVSDFCGTLGSALTSLTIAVEPGMVSSIEFKPGENAYTNKPFNFEACPTFGWSDPFTTSYEFQAGSFSSYLTSTLGPPYHPIISPIPQLYVAQPAYSQCSVWRSLGYRAEPFYGAYDPPRVLTPVSAMAAPTSSPVVADPKITSSATPQQTASVQLAKTTASPSQKGQPDPKPQQSINLPIVGGLPLDGPQVAPSEPTATGKADPLATESSVSHSRDRLSSNNDPVHSAAPIADPKQGAGRGSSVSGDGGLADPKATALASNTGGGHANVHGASVTDTAAVPIFLSSLPSLGGQRIETAASGVIVVGGSSIAAGSHTVIQGITISNAHDSVVLIDGTSYVRPAVDSPGSPATAPVVTIGSSTYTVDTASRLIVEGQTLTPGEAITIYSNTISYLSGGSNVVVGTNTQKLSATRINNAQDSRITFAGSTYTVGSSSGLVIQGQTLTPGGTITIQGTPVNYRSDGNEVLIGTSTQRIATTAAQIAQDSVLTFAGSTYTVGSSSRLVIQGQTLTPGGTMTIQGTPVNYRSDGNEVIIGTSTQRIATTAAQTAQDSVLTFAGSTYTEKSSAFLIDGQTLSKGGAITVSGTPISFAAAGTDVVVGSSTEAVQLGSYIVGGFGSGSPTNVGGTTASGTSGPFTGNQPRLDSNIWLLSCSIIIAMAVSILAVVI